MKIENCIAILDSLPLFEDFTPAQKEMLVRQGTIVKYKKDTYLFHQGDEIKNFYIICSGVVKLFRSNSSGTEKTIDILLARGLLGKVEIFEKSKTYYANALAVEDCILLSFPKTWLLDTTKKCHIFAVNLLAILSRKLFLSEIESEQKSTMSAPQLVACFLEKLCTLNNLDPKNFELPYPKSLIASRLGMEAETFSRALSKLRDHGIIISGAHISMKNFDAIKKLACNHCSVEEECSLHRSFGKKINS